MYIYNLLYILHLKDKWLSFAFLKKNISGHEMYTEGGGGGDAYVPDEFGLDLLYKYQWLFVYIDNWHCISRQHVSHKIILKKCLKPKLFSVSSLANGWSFNINSI